jgi:antitoxin ChpS
VSAPDLLAPPDDAAVTAAGRAFVSALRERYGDRLTGVYLFGSRARGDFRPFSDLDVAIVLAGGAEALSEEIALSDLAYDLLLETGAEIQPWLFSAAEWVDPSRSAQADLIRAVRQDGRALWARA